MPTIMLWDHPFTYTQTQIAGYRLQSRNMQFEDALIAQLEKDYSSYRGLHLLYPVAEELLQGYQQACFEHFAQILKDAGADEVSQEELMKLCEHSFAIYGRELQNSVYKPYEKMLDKQRSRMQVNFLFRLFLWLPDYGIRKWEHFLLLRRYFNGITSAKLYSALRCTIRDIADSVWGRIESEVRDAVERPVADTEKDVDAVINNLETGVIPKALAKEYLLMVLKADPLKREAYELAFGMFGSEDGALEQLASSLGVDIQTCKTMIGNTRRSEAT